MDNSDLWTNILAKIKKETNSLSYQTWFEDTKLYSLEKGVAKILVPYALHKDHLANNYKKLITSCFIEEIGETVELEFVIKEDLDTTPEEENQSQNDIKEKNIYENNVCESNLNKKYTFENFIVGNSNRFAHAAALAVAEKPGETYNPLFIYGNSGLGKTHLMHAIGNYIAKHSNKKVLYVTSETFVSEFVEITKKQGNKSRSPAGGFADKYGRN